MAKKLFHKLKKVWKKIVKSFNKSFEKIVKLLAMVCGRIGGGKIYNIKLIK
jgi:hypothetical protein